MGGNEDARAGLLPAVPKDKRHKLRHKELSLKAPFFFLTTQLQKGAHGTDYANCPGEGTPEGSCHEFECFTLSVELWMVGDEMLGCSLALGCQ